MSVSLEKLKTEARVLIEVALKPVAGTRIQPTGFPDLGPATYEVPGENGDVIPTLLVESAQSMANRLEAVCWDEAADDIVPELKGLPFVKVKLTGLGDGSDTTCSLLEFHRLNSPYIMSGLKDGKPFTDVLTPELGLATQPKKKKDGEPAADGEGADVAGVVNLRTLAKVCFRYDPNSLVHGVFLEKIAGRLRHPRALSAFIEATGVGRADSGGVKFDRAMPKPLKGLDAKTGYGNVPFHRTEFTAKAITAYFSLDLSQLRGYGLPDDATALLIVLSLWKVRKFLDSTMRLRSACELEIDTKAGGVQGKRPEGFVLPSAAESAEQLKKLIMKCKPHFADPAVTLLTWTAPKAK
jgi:CRISPR-associated protein Csb1